VNSERADFSIPRETTGTLFFADEISLNAIRDGALAVIGEDLKSFIDEINMQKETALTRPHLLRRPGRPSVPRADEIQGRVHQRHPQANKTELEMALHRQLYQRQVGRKQEFARILSEPTNTDNPQDYYARLQKFVEDENEIGKTSLSQYIAHRRVILELLEKYLSQDPGTGDYGLEKTVHSLVFRMRSTSDDVPFEQRTARRKNEPHLWSRGEQFAGPSSSILRFESYQAA
jgi:hypothetical protein